MKLTKRHLRKIIKEELAKVLALERDLYQELSLSEPGDTAPVTELIAMFRDQKFSAVLSRLNPQERRIVELFIKFTISMSEPGTQMTQRILSLLEQISKILYSKEDSAAEVRSTGQPAGPMQGVPAGSDEVAPA